MYGEVPGRHYYSPERRELFERMCSSATTVIEAPSGYGKTTAVRDFLSAARQSGATLRRFTVTENSVKAAWRFFAECVREFDPAAGARLLKLGLPGRVSAGEVAEIIRGLTCESDYYLVFDNAHHIQQLLPQSVIRALIEHGGAKLHLVLITRQLLRPLQTKRDDVLFIGVDDLRFSTEDIFGFAAIMDVELTEQEAETILTFTEGWVIAVVLMLMYKRQSGQVAVSTNVMGLMRLTMWDCLQPDDWAFLAFLSPLESATVEQICFVHGLDELPPERLALLENLPFLRYEADTGRYYPHSLLRRLFLQELTGMGTGMRRDSYSRVGRWYALRGNQSAALSCFWEVRDYEGILSMPLTGLLMEPIDGQSDMLDVALGVLRDCPASLHQKYPLALMRIAYILLGYGEYAEYEALMAIVRRIIDRTERGEEQDNLQAQWHLLTSLASVPDLDKMTAQLRLAKSLYRGGECIIDKGEPFLFAVPSMWYLFHLTPGAAEQTLERYSAWLELYTSLTNGHGAGSDLLFEAELHCLCEQYEVSEITANRAYKVTGHWGQSSLQLGALLLLGIIAMCRGEQDALSDRLDMLDELGAQVERLGSVLYKNVLALISGLLLSVYEQSDRSEPWLQQGDWHRRLPGLHAGQVSYVSISSLLLRREYARAAQVLKLAQGEGVLKTVAGRQYAGLASAICHYQLGNTEMAQAALRDAAEVSRPDRLFGTFSRIVRPGGRLASRRVEKVITQALRREGIELKTPHVELEADARLFSEADRTLLSKRESEIARLAAQGLRNSEIALKLGLSEHTVKTYLKMVFQKLRVDRRGQLKNFF